MFESLNIYLNNEGVFVFKIVFFFLVKKNILKN